MDEDKTKKEEAVAEEVSAVETTEAPVETEAPKVEETVAEVEEVKPEEVVEEVKEEKVEEVKAEEKKEEAPVVEKAKTKKELDDEAKAAEVAKKAQAEEVVEPVEKEKPAKKVHPDARWFVINTYSGHEKKVAQLIEQRVKANELEKQIVEVLVPTQEKILVSEGKKKTLEEKIFPGYVLVHMVMNDETWYLVRNTEGVTGFVGTQRKPTPLSEEEVKGILAFSEIQQPSFQASFAVGDAVKVGDGPFKDFVGSISEINEDKGQVKVLLSVFGRETPVVLDFLQVSKL